MLITAEELRTIGVREEAVEQYLNSKSQLPCCQWVLAALHHLNVINRNTYEYRLRELTDMSSVELAVVARKADGTPNFELIARQHFNEGEKERETQYQEELIVSAAPAFETASKALRERDLQG